MTTVQVYHTIDPGNIELVHLICEGDLTIHAMEEITGKLMTVSPERYNRLNLMVRNVSSIDFAFFQLTIVLVYDFLASGNKTFSFDFQVSAEIRDLLTRSGLLKVFETCRDNKSTS